MERLPESLDRECLHSILAMYRMVAIAPMIHNPILENFSSLTGSVALIGGTFDPVHNGHLHMAKAVLARIPAVQAVVFIPARQNPLKPNPPVASDTQRLEMLRLALAEAPKLFVSPIETCREGKSYTVDTLRRIRSEMHPQTVLNLVIGADQLERLHQWQDIDGIFKLATVFVLGRKGVASADVTAHANGLPEHLTRILEHNFIPFSHDISATGIRASVRAGHPEVIEGELPPAVLSFILHNGVYR